MLVAIPATAQIFNFSLRTNNQQLIDKALAGSFVRINQSYELYDTINDEHFGRDDKDYFNIVPFIGVKTEKGLVFPATTMTPWTLDTDFDKYKDRYKPLVTKSTVSLLNSVEEQYYNDSESPISGSPITKHLCYMIDTVPSLTGLTIDSLPGEKDGWLFWLSSNQNLTDTDSLKITSIKKILEVPTDGECLRIDTPEISETVYGGVYVTPIQTSIGQLTFTLTGVMVLDEEGWVLDFPFIQKPQETKKLTPINDLSDKNKLNQLKKKKK